jgi:hypothetical protein
MPSDTIEYGRYVERALRRVVRDALAEVAERGLPGRHHIYLTFETTAPGVTLSDALRARYPGEMTIVLQHEWWALQVDEESFGVTLSFNSTPERIVVPYDAVKLFADPSVDFGLQFQVEGDAAEQDENVDAEEPVAEIGETQHRPAPVTALPKPDAAAETPSDGSADVVPLDRFRKK